MDVVLCTATKTHRKKFSEQHCCPIYMDNPRMYTTSENKHKQCMDYLVLMIHFSLFVIGSSFSRLIEFNSNIYFIQCWTTTISVN